MALLIVGGRAGAAMTDRLVWLFGFDLRTPSEAERAVRVLENGARHHINGAVLSIEMAALSGKDPAGAAGLKAVRDACDRLKMEFIPATFSFGYGGPFLSVNPNLAEGLAVTDALFVAGAEGTAALVPDPAVEIPDGGFEFAEGDRFGRLGFQDAPGKISFADRAVRHSGNSAIRLTNFVSDPHGHGRVHVSVAVRPHRCYRVGLWAKSDHLGPKDAFHIETLAQADDKERNLADRTFDLPPTADWTKFTYLFNSGANSHVALYAGVWEGKSGTLWLDDWTIEEVGPVNVLRRPGTPVVVRSAGGTLYVEGKDYEPLVDPNFRLWRQDQPAPGLRLRSGGRIGPGARLRVSWYHPQIVYRDQVGVCMAEPEIYEIARREAKALAALHPKRVLLNMDEVRFGGTCAACAGRDMARLLGESVTSIQKILEEEIPGVRVLAWSDMFDPNHNAHGDYYDVAGDFTGSWKHIPKSLGMAVWGSDAEPKTFDHFQKEGFPVLGACYYDADDLTAVAGWVEQAKRHRNVTGLMYTTWEGRYDLLGAFGDLLGR